MKRKPENNLSVIENFILYFMHSSENDNEANDCQLVTPKMMYEAARNYIQEDHVDGYDSDEEILIDLHIKIEDLKSDKVENEKEIEKLQKQFDKLYNKNHINKKYVDNYISFIVGG